MRLNRGHNTTSRSLGISYVNGHGANLSDSNLCSEVHTRMDDIIDIPIYMRLNAYTISANLYVSVII